jgi:hypothetical protein
MVYGQLFDKANDQELRSLKKLGMRWKVCREKLDVFALTPTSTRPQEYEKQGKWVSNVLDTNRRTVASDAEDGPDLRTASVLVLRLDILGVALGGARLVLAPFPLGPRVFQG